jgi:hypothetical protein
VLTVAAEEKTAVAAFSDDESLIAIAIGTTIAMYDTTGRQLWRHEEPSLPQTPALPRNQAYQAVELEPLRFAGPLLRIDLTPSADFPTPLYTPPRNRVWLNTKTGMPDKRFAGMFDVVLSPDQHLAISTDNVGMQQVVDLEANHVLWSLPILREPLRLLFNEDGVEVVAWHAHSGQLAAARWRARDGKEIAPLLQDELNSWPLYALSADGRYAAAQDSRGLRAPRWLKFAVNFVGIPWNGQLRRGQPTVELIDTSSNGYGAICSRNTTPLIALFTALWIDRWPLELHALPGGQRFAISDPFGLSIFRFPPPRDWWWLVQWSLGPPVVVASIRLTWRRWRSRLTRKHGQSVPGSVAPSGDQTDTSATPLPT